MITRMQKVRLGVFVAVSLLLLVGTLVTLTGLRIAEKRDTYTVRYTMSLSGLEEGAQVKFNGVRVGRVDDIRINREDVGEVIVTLSLQEGTPVKEDARAVVNLAGITGLKFIEITGGTAESRFVEPGGEIDAGESFLDRLTGKAENIAEKAELLLNQLNKATSASNQDRVFKAVDDINELVMSATRILEENRENVHAVTTSMREVGDGLSSTIDQIEHEAVATMRSIRVTVNGLKRALDSRKIGRIVTNVDRISGVIGHAVDEADLPAIFAQIQGLAEKAKKLVTDVDITVLRARESMYASLYYLQETMENLSEFSRAIRENPSLLLGGEEEEERKLP